MALVVVLAGCGSSTSNVDPRDPRPRDPDPRPRDRDPRCCKRPPLRQRPPLRLLAFTGSVVMIPKQINNPYFDVAYTGAQNAAKVYGGTLTQVGPAPLTRPSRSVHPDRDKPGAKAIIVSADDANRGCPGSEGGHGGRHQGRRL